MNTKTHICKNGLKVFTNTNKTNPLVSIQFCVESGSIHENEFLGSGMSHLIEHMVFKGTKEFDCEHLAEETAKLGGMINAYTTENRTVFYITGPSEYYKEFIHILTQLVFFPTFPKEEFEREKDVIRREMDLCKDNIGHFAYFTLMETVYNSNNKKYPVIGYRNRFDSITHKDMVDYYKKHYSPTNAFVCVVGDIDENNVVDVIEHEVASIKSNNLVKPVQEVDGYPFVGKRITKTFNKPASTYIAAWHIPEVGSKGYVCMYIYANIIGSGETSILYTKFHDELNLVHSIEAYVLPSTYDCSLFVIEAELDEYKTSEFDKELTKYILSDQDYFNEINYERVEQFTMNYKLNKLNNKNCVESIANNIVSNYSLHKDPNYDVVLDNLIFNSVNLASDIKFNCGEYLDHTMTNILINPLKETEENSKEGTQAQKGIYNVKLKNGAKVNIIRNSKKETTDITIAFKAGCRAETKETAGINNLMAALMLKSTSNRSLKEIADDINKLGKLTYYAGQNTISFSCSCLIENTASMIDLLSDIILNATYSEEYLDNEKKSIIAAIDYYKTVPKVLAKNKLLQNCFSESTYGNSSLGYEESINNITRDDILRNANCIFCGSNAYICISTAFPHTDVIRFLERKFSAMERGYPLILQETCEFKSGEASYSYNKEQAVIAVGFSGCDVHSDDVASEYIFEAWLKNMSGPLFTEVREKLGLSYHTTVDTFFGTDAGYMIFYVVTSNENIEKADSALNLVIDKLIEYGMTEDEFNKAKLLVKSSTISRNQFDSNIVKFAAIDMANGKPYDYTLNFVHELDKVTVKDVNNFIKNTLSNKSNKVTIVSSKN